MWGWAEGDPHPYALPTSLTDLARTDRFWRVGLFVGVGLQGHGVGFSLSGAPL